MLASPPLTCMLASAWPQTSSTPTMACNKATGCSLPLWHNGMCEVPADILSSGRPARVRKRTAAADDEPEAQTASARRRRAVATDGDARTNLALCFVGDGRRTKCKAKAVEAANVPTGRGASSSASHHEAAEQAEAAAAAETEAMEEEEEADAALRALGAEHGLQSPTSQVAAAREVLRSEFGEEQPGLLQKHQLGDAPQVVEGLLRVARALAWASPPSGAFDVREPANAAMVTNLQMLLQTSTSSAASRAPPEASFVAVAVELSRNARLPVRTACIRHGLWVIGRGETPGILHRSAADSARRRIGALRDEMASLRLLEMDLHTPIEPALVEELRSQVKVSISQAAIAIRRCGDDLTAATTQLREETGQLLGYDEEETRIVQLRSELKIKAPLNYVAASREVTRHAVSVWSSTAAEGSSFHVGASSAAAGSVPIAISFESLCERHDILKHNNSIEQITSIARQLALHEPPAYAVDFANNSADAYLVHNLQLLLMTPTSSGGLASRSKQAFNFIALAVELAREPSLNFQAACIRQGVKSGHHLLSQYTINHAWERIKPTADELVERQLLALNHTQPIGRDGVDAVRQRVKVAISEAAEALLEHEPSMTFHGPQSTFH